MDVNRRLGMRDTVLALLLAVLQGFPLGETAPNPSPLVGSNWGNPRRYVHLQTSTDLNNFYLEIRLDGTVRKTTVRSSYSKICFLFPEVSVFFLWCGSMKFCLELSNALCLFFPAGVILLKAETRERIAILGVKSSRYLCMDLEGNPFSSVSQYWSSVRLIVAFYRFLILNFSLSRPLTWHPCASFLTLREKESSFYAQTYCNYKMSYHSFYVIILLISSTNCCF